MKRLLVLSLLLLLAGITDSRSQTINLEVDPIPYTFNGFSLSGGVDLDRISFELEVFGIDVPRAFHGNEGFSQYVRGTSARAAYFFSGTGGGLFTGLDLDLSSATFTLKATGSEESRTQVTAGLSVGYEWPLTDHLYVKPWAGLGYMFTASDITIDGRTFERNTLRPFPAVNLGWRF
jgi:hypothetical protein